MEPLIGYKSTGLERKEISNRFFPERWRRSLVIGTEQVAFEGEIPGSERLEPRHSFSGWRGLFLQSPLFWIKSARIGVPQLYLGPRQLKGTGRCRERKPSGRRARTSAPGNRRVRRPASSSRRKWTRSAAANTAQGRRDRRLPLDYRKRAVPASISSRRRRAGRARARAAVRNTPMRPVKAGASRAAVPAFRAPSRKH